MAEIESFPRRENSQPRLEELYAGLHEVTRLIELEHLILRQRLDGLKADSDGARLLEGMIALGGVVTVKLSGLLRLCRDAGDL
jgi:hypothetical protein